MERIVRGTLPKVRIGLELMGSLKRYWEAKYTYPSLVKISRRAF